MTGRELGGAEWMDQAVCAGTDPDLWFPDKGQTSKKAVQICKTCPVRVECLAFAFKIHATHGVWGGLRVEERKGLSTFLQLGEET